MYWPLRELRGASSTNSFAMGLSCALDACQRPCRLVRCIGRFQMEEVVVKGSSLVCDIASLPCVEIAPHEMPSEVLCELNYFLLCVCVTSRVVVG